MTESPPLPLAVTGLAGVSPVGLTMAATCAALRAGISRFHEHPFYRPELPDPPLVEPEPARISSVRAGRPGQPLPLAERLLELSLCALQGLPSALGLSRGDARAMSLFLCLPDADSPRPAANLPRSLASRLCSDLGIEVAAASQIQSGRIGTFCAIVQAAQALQQRRCTQALIVSVDSQIDGPTLGWLDATWRLKSERNTDGFIPGECAAALRLELPEHARDRNVPILGLLTAMGTAQEPDPLGGPRRSSGTGLCAAVAEALLGLLDEQCFFSICDLNGESYRAQEWGILTTRLGARFQNQRALWHPADCIGDVGAASAALYIAMACRAFARRAVDADAALITCAADDGARAACRVEPATRFS